MKTQFEKMRANRARREAAMRIEKSRIYERQNWEANREYRLRYEQLDQEALQRSYEPEPWWKKLLTV